MRPPPNSTEPNSIKSNGHSTADEELEIKIESPDFGVAISSGQHRPPPAILWLRNRAREGPGFVSSLTLGRAVPEMSPQVRFRSATSIDFGILRGWLRQCHWLHANFCGLAYEEGALPHTLIDCEARVKAGTLAQRTLDDYRDAIEIRQRKDGQDAKTGFLRTFFAPPITPPDVTPNHVALFLHRPGRHRD